MLAYSFGRTWLFQIYLYSLKCLKWTYVQLLEVIEDQREFFFHPRYSSKIHGFHSPFDLFRIVYSHIYLHSKSIVYIFYLLEHFMQKKCTHNHCCNEWLWYNNLSRFVRTYIIYIYIQDRIECKITILYIYIR